jgi:hypothetical protein
VQYQQPHLQEEGEPRRHSGAQHIMYPLSEEGVLGGGVCVRRSGAGDDRSRFDVCMRTARPIDLLRDMPQFVIIEPKHSAKQNYVPVSNLR